MSTMDPKTKKYITYGGIAIVVAGVAAYAIWRYGSQKEVSNFAVSDSLLPGGVVRQANTRGGVSETIENKPVLVYLYANWCHFCQDMMGEWAQVEGQLKGKVKTVKLESEDPRAANFQVPGYPTIRVYPEGLDVGTGDGGGFPVIDFKGQRKAGDICAFALSFLSKPNNEKKNQ